MTQCIVVPRPPGVQSNEIALKSTLPVQLKVCRICSFFSDILRVLAGTFYGFVGVMGVLRSFPMILDDFRVGIFARNYTDIRSPPSRQIRGKHGDTFLDPEEP